MADGCEGEFQVLRIEWMDAIDVHRLEHIPPPIDCARLLARGSGTTHWHLGKTPLPTKEL